MLKRIIASIWVKERMPFTNLCYAIVRPLDNLRKWLLEELEPIYITIVILHTMNSILILVLLSLTLVAATFVFSIPDAVQARISYCASGTDIFQCFIKQNDCEAFVENHPETTCVRSKT